ncbi:MAG TPA: PHP domain-containing protein, partial [Candidatus Methanoperedens sp.]|nr:PHP domain-containing protein [Candidatus Methanoperedens sp.]
MAPFTHLHVHSCFSFHDGADAPAALVARAAELGYTALALTDANGLYGAVPFCKAAQAAGIAPLLGAEIDGGDADGPRAVVLARGRAGYPALCRIVTRRKLEWSEGDKPPCPPFPKGGIGTEAFPKGETASEVPRSESAGIGMDAGVARRGGLHRADRREHGGGPQRQDPGVLHGPVAPIAGLIASETGSVVVITSD